MKDYIPPKSSDELLLRYQNGERHFAQAELDGPNYDLRNANLEGADLSHSFITADFRGANLRGVDFTSSNIKTCDFRGAELHEAIFSGALLEGTRFDGAFLEGAKFDGATCFGRTLESEEKPWW